MDLLIYLAERGGHVATKDEILDAVWPETQVAEVALSRSISELRRLLGDDAKQPSYVETIHKTGYRLLMLPQPVRDGARPSRAAVWGAVVVGLVLLGFGVWSAYRAWPIPGSDDNDAPSIDVATGAPRIVILPFANLGSPDDAYFARGLAEEITSRLASVAGLGVISRTSALRFEGGGHRVAEIGKELDVDYILEGVMQWERLGNAPVRVRISPQLIRVTDDTHVWREIYDRELGDSLNVQAEIAGEVTRLLGLTLLAVESGISPKTMSLEAYQAYLGGLDAAARTSYNEDDARLASEMFSQAVEADPGYADAFAELSKAHSWLYHLGYDRSEERLSLARAAAEAALELEPASGVGRLALGHYYYRGLQDYDRALMEYSRAAESLPGRADLTAHLAYVARRQGRVEEALAPLRRAYRLDPFSYEILFDLAATYAYLRRYEEAIALAERLIALEPMELYGYYLKARSLIMWRGDTKGARAVLAGAPLEDEAAMLVRALFAYMDRDCERALEAMSAYPQTLYLSQDGPVPLALVTGWLQDACGRRQDAQASYRFARAQLEAHRAAHPHDFTVLVSLSHVLAGLGNRAAAIEHIADAAEHCGGKDFLACTLIVAEAAAVLARVGESERSLDLLEWLLSVPSEMSVPWIAADPSFDSLRDHPRYHELAAADWRAPN